VKIKRKIDHPNYSGLIFLKAKNMALATPAAPFQHVVSSYQLCYPNGMQPPINSYKAPSPTSSSSASASDKDRSTPQSDEKEIAHSKTNLYIKGLNEDTTDADLENLCKAYGKITSTKAIINNEPGKGCGKCKGYGFVDFAHENDADKAVTELKKQGIQVQLAKVKCALQQEQDPTNIYWQNLPEHIDENELQKIVEPYGEVVSTRVLKHTEGSPHAHKSKGVGFVRMKNKEMCEKVIDAFNDKPLQDPRSSDSTKPVCSLCPGKPLVVKFADAADKNKKKKNYSLTRQETTHYPMQNDSMLMLPPSIPQLTIPAAAVNFPPQQPGYFPVQQNIALNHQFLSVAPNQIALPHSYPHGMVGADQGYPVPYAVPQPYHMEHVTELDQEDSLPNGIPLNGLNGHPGNNGPQQQSPMHHSAPHHQPLPHMHPQQIAPIYYQQVA
jgi:hypothetical protein